jgi:predicted secreted protein
LKGLEEIIVTAQRRAEDMQTVPIAVFAATAKDLGQVSFMMAMTNAQKEM